MPTNWQLSGDYFENCNCSVVCPCLISPAPPLTSRPTEGVCDVALAFHIDKGNYGTVALDDLNLALIAHTPGIIEFRHVDIKELNLVAAPPVAPVDGWVPLFNGKDLAGWKVYDGKQDAWGVDNGLLYVKGGGGGWLMTAREYGDFELGRDSGYHEYVGRAAA